VSKKRFVGIPIGTVPENQLSASSSDEGNQRVPP